MAITEKCNLGDLKPLVNIPCGFKFDNRREVKVFIKGTNQFTMVKV